MMSLAQHPVCNFVFSYALPASPENEYEAAETQQDDCCRLWDSLPAQVPEYSNFDVAKIMAYLVVERRHHIIAEWFLNVQV